MKTKTITLFALTMILLSSGCISQKEEYRFKNDKTFLSGFMCLREKAFSENISPKNVTKAPSYNDDIAYLRVCYPIDDLSGNGIEVPNYEAVTTLSDIERIVVEYGAQLSIVEDPTVSEDIIAVSEESIQIAIQPMIQQSKQYLYSLGVNDSDIAEMLEDADANESVLVPFSIALVESDIHYLTQRKARRNSLIPTAYAALSWGDAGACALEALGFDVVLALDRSGASVLTKAAMKKALKAVAKRCVSYIGVAIFVIDFGICLGHA